MAGMSNRRFSTGVERLDDLLGGLKPGDNVVLEVDSGVPVDVFLGGFFKVAQESSVPVVLVSFNHSPQTTIKSVPDFFPREQLRLIDCFTSGKGQDDEVFSSFYGRDPEAGIAHHIQDPSSPDELRKALAAIEEEGSGARFLFDSLTGMLELWHEESKVLDFFSYYCPRLYDLETVAYWMLEKQAHTEAFLATLRHVTQVVLEMEVEVGRNRLVARKVEGRRSASIGIPHTFGVEKGEPVFAPEGREERELGVLSEIAATIGDSLVLDEMFERVMNVLANRLGLMRGTLITRDPVTGGLKIAHAYGLTPAERRRGAYKVGEGITGHVVQTGEPVAVPDIRHDPRFLDRTRVRRVDEIDRRVSFICVPLRTEDEIVGALSGDRDYVSDEILQKDLRLMMIVASIIAQAMKINRMVSREKEDILAENVELRKGLADRYSTANIIGASGRMREVLAIVGTVAPSNATVLIYGETGTGKELIARAIHHNSKRADKPFLALNCGALPDSLLESELFGHVRGAFTGAVEERKGRFELASGGTMFLDEVGDISPRLQVRLLRVLQEKEFEPVGGSKTLASDVRVVAATNRDLEAEVREGRFREDLYYRLNVVPIYLPPLRDRREDIPLLLEHFLEEYNRENLKSVTKLSQEVLDLIMAYPWPGNVRELENAVERAVVMATRGEITKDLLPLAVRTFAESRSAPGDQATEPQMRRLLSAYCLRASDVSLVHRRLQRMIDEVAIRHALRVAKGSQRQAAKALGMSRTTLRKKMKELGFAT